MQFSIYNRRKYSPLMLMLFMFCVAFKGKNNSNTDILLSKISLPPGFHISYYASDVKNARQMAWGTKGTLFVGTRNEGKVYAISDKNGDGKADNVRVIASGLNNPNGVAFRNGALYVAEISRIIKFENIEDKLENPPPFKIVSEDFPTDNHHGNKYISFGPDGKLYVPVGAPCNVCENEDKRYASITRMNEDGTNHEVFASGVRNTVGFDWHPVSKELWFTDNGRDWLGENRPPDELNRAHKSGLHFGFPYCHGGNLSDPKFGHKRKCIDLEAPVQNLDPHVACLGMKFYTGKMFPDEYKNQVFIAEHGSWNKVKPSGYRITLVKLTDNKAFQYNVFAEGWYQKGEKYGRPVDVLLHKDGSMLVSDDYAGCIYRIWYDGK